jgi:hypothetical protein
MGFLDRPLKRKTMSNNTQDSDIVHTFPNGLQLTVGEVASGQFGWWIDAPGSETKLLTFGRHSTTRSPYPRGLLQGEEPTFDAAVQAGKKAWLDKYGTTGG